MQRRLFLKTASATTLATLATRNVWAAPAPRIAFGGIGMSRARTAVSEPGWKTSRSFAAIRR